MKDLADCALAILEYLDVPYLPLLRLLFGTYSMTANCRQAYVPAAILIVVIVTKRYSHRLNLPALERKRILKRLLRVLKAHFLTR